MFRATAVELQARPIQPLDGNNSPLLCTVTLHSFVARCVWFCAPFSLFLSLNSNQPIYGFTVHVYVCFSGRLSLRHPRLPEVSSSKAAKPPISFVLQMRPDLPGSIKFQIILQENISRKWWQGNNESAAVQHYWDYHFTRRACIFLQLCWRKSVDRFLITDPEGKVLLPFLTFFCFL